MKTVWIPLTSYKDCNLLVLIPIISVLMIFTCSRKRCLTLRSRKINIVNSTKKHRTRNRNINSSFKRKTQRFKK